MIIDELKNRKVLSAPEAVRYGYIALKQNIVTIMIILLMIYFPINILRAYLSVEVVGLENRIDISTILADAELVQSFIKSPEYIKIIAYDMSDTLIQIALVPFGSMAVIYVVNEAFEGRNTGYKDALSVAFSNGGRFLLSMIIYYICIVILLILGVIPGIACGVIWYFYLFAIVLDDCPGISSLGRSRKLVTKRWFKTFLYAVVFICMTYVVSYVVDCLFTSASEVSYISVVVSEMLLSLFNMLIVAAQTAVYVFYKNNIVAK